MPVSDEDFKALKDKVDSLVESNKNSTFSAIMNSPAFDKVLKIVIGTIVAGLLAWNNEKGRDIQKTLEVHDVKLDTAANAAASAEGEAKAAKSEAAAAKTVASANKEEIKAELTTIKKKQDETKTAIDKK